MPGTAWVRPVEDSVAVGVVFDTFALGIGAAPASTAVIDGSSAAPRSRSSSAAPTCRRRRRCRHRSSDAGALCDETGTTLRSNESTIADVGSVVGRARAPATIVVLRHRPHYRPSMSDRRLPTSTARRASVIEESSSRNNNSNSNVGEGAAHVDTSTTMDSPTSPTTARLEHMFELLNILDASDDTLIRRLEAELLRTDAEQMRQDAREDERDIDAAIDRDLLQSMSDTDPTRRTDLQNLLLAFSGRLNADDLSRSVQSPERGAHQDDVGQVSGRRTHGHVVVAERTCVRTD